MALDASCRRTGGVSIRGWKRSRNHRFVRLKMSTDIPYAYSTPQVVYGIKLEDSRSAVLVKRVTNVSLCLLMCSYTHALFYGNFQDGFSMIIVILSLMCVSLVPCCGYYGAKQRDRGLLTVFWVCNCLGVVCFLYTLISLFIAASVFAGSHDCFCKDPSKPIKSATTGECIEGTFIGKKPYCGMASGSALILDSTLVIVGGLLSFFSCIWGRELAQQPTFVEIRSGYDVTPVGVIEENVVVDVDYAELKWLAIACCMNKYDKISLKVFKNINIRIYVRVCVWWRIKFSLT